MQAGRASFYRGWWAGLVVRVELESIEDGVAKLFYECVRMVVAGHPAAR